MTTESNSPDPAAPGLAEAIIADPEIRQLDAGSEAYAARVEKIEKAAAKAAKAGQTPVQDPTEEPPVEEPPEEQSEPVARKKGLDKRFSELTTERDTARQRAAELEARLAEVEKRAGSQVPAFTPAAYDGPKPNVDNFDTYGEYQEALVDWKLEKKEFDRQQHELIQQATKQQDQVIGTWDAREATVKSRLEGYDELVNPEFVQRFTSGPQPLAAREAMQFLLESEAGPELLYALAEDDEKLEAFQKMSSVRQVAYLAKLEGQFEPAPDEPKPKVSKAPTPSKSLPRGNGAGSFKDFPQTGGTFNEYLEWRGRQK